MINDLLFSLLLSNKTKLAIFNSSLLRACTYVFYTLVDLPRSSVFLSCKSTNYIVQNRLILPKYELYKFVFHTDIFSCIYAVFRQIIGTKFIIDAASCVMPDDRIWKNFVRIERT